MSKAEGAEAKRWAMGSARGSGQGGGSSRALGRQLLDVGPCSKDGEVKLDEDTGIIVALRGPYSQPYCQIKPSGGRENACLDVEREQVVPGARLDHQVGLQENQVELLRKSGGIA